MKVLLTGFEPFGEEKRNPSWEAVRLLPEEVAGISIARLQLPVVYDACVGPLFAAIRRERPDAVLCVGQAGGRCGITPEFLAVNVKDARGADNAGQRYCGERIVEGGPAAYETTLPVRAMVAALRQEGIPASLSYSAGTYVCNNLLYHLLHGAAAGAFKKAGALRAGFVHIPYDERQAVEHGGSVPFLPLSLAAKGLEICVRALGPSEGGPLLGL